MSEKIWNVKNIREKMIEYVKVAEEFYEKDLMKNFPEVKINENKRITRNLGMFKYGYGKALSLEVSRYLLNKYNDELIEGVIGHEVAHYITFELFGAGHGHDKVFKQVCKAISKLGIEIDGGTKAINSEKYIKEGYVESKKETKEVRNPRNVRYIRTCPECDYSWHREFKVARKDSIKKWTQDWYCKKHGHGLIVFDIKENLKYWSSENYHTGLLELNKEAMTEKEKEICLKMLD